MTHILNRFAVLESRQASTASATANSLRGRTSIANHRDDLHRRRCHLRQAGLSRCLTTVSSDDLVAASTETISATTPEPGPRATSFLSTNERSDLFRQGLYRSHPNIAVAEHTEGSITPGKYLNDDLPADEHFMQEHISKAPQEEVSGDLGLFLLRENQFSSPIKAIMDAVHQKERDQLLHRLRIAKKSDLRLLSDSQFSQIIRALHPNAFYPVGDPLGDGNSWSPLNHPTYQDIREHEAQRNRMVYNTGTVDAFFRRYTKIISRLLAIRSEDRLGVGDYAHLLGQMALIGRRGFAESIWRDMRSKEVQPSLDCWNSYIQSKIFGNWLNDRWKQFDRPGSLYLHSRMTPSNQFPDLRNPLKAGYRVGPGGLKSEVEGLISEMTYGGLRGNERTYCLLIAATAREADLGGVKSILRNIWGIDVDELTHPKNKSRPLHEFGLKTFSRDSPLRPTSQLLQVVTQAFGSTGNTRISLRLIDVICRQYSLRSPAFVWETLLYWTSFECRRRRGRSHRDIASRRTLPIAAMHGVWNIMTSPPHNVKPTMRMYDIFVRSQIDRHKWVTVSRLIKQAIPLSRSSTTTAHRAQKRLSSKQGSDGSTSWSVTSTSGPILESLHDLHRRYNRALLVSQMNRWRIRSWIALMARRATPANSGKYRALTSYRIIPAIAPSVPPTLRPRRISVRTHSGRLNYRLVSMRDTMVLRALRTSREQNELGEVVREIYRKGGWTWRLDWWLRKLRKRQVSKEVAAAVLREKSAAIQEALESERTNTEAKRRTDTL